MSLLPKLKIPTDTPTTLATPATFRPESSKSSGSSNPQAAQKPEFQVSEEVNPLLAGNPLNGDVLGITVTDVLRVFEGGQVIGESLICRHCNEKKKRASHERKDGAIIRRIRVDGVHVWACHFCGREAKRSRKSVHTIH